MLNRNDIIKILSEYGFSRDEFVVISSAALVLLGIKESTNDIDLATTSELYNTLLEKYSCVFERSVGEHDVWYIDELINFSTNYYDGIDYIKLEGFCVQSLNSVLKLKQQMNRDKDKCDIERILNYKKIMGRN